METYQAVMILMLIDVLALWLGVTLKRHGERSSSTGTVPMLEFALVVIVCVLAHVICTQALRVTLDMNEPSSLVILLVASSASGFLPLLYFTSLVIEKLSSLSGGTMALSNTRRGIETDFSKAQSLFRRGDIDGAIAQCRQYFEDFPQSPRPLFEAQRYLALDHRHREEMQILREIRKRFRDDEDAWARATVSMANICDEINNDRETAELLWHQVVHRSPDSRSGRTARNRLKRGTADEEPELVDIEIDID